MKFNFLFSSALSLVMLAQTSIASDRVLSHKVYYETTTESVTHSGKSLNGGAADLKLISNQVSVVTYERCDMQEGDGSRSDWNGFYNAPAEQKASALSGAIRGVGVNTAEQLIALGTFSSKPRSWSEFKERIRSADSQVSGNLYENVVQKYGSDNKQNLGYLVQVCQTFEDKQITNRIGRRVQLAIQGAPLLMNESETITISMKGNGNNQANYSVEASSRYNDFAVVAINDNPYSGYSEIIVRGTRKQVTPPNSLDVTITSTSTGAITVRNTAFDRDVTPTSGAKIRVTVTQTKGSWRSSDTLETKEFDLNTTGPDTTINGLNMSASEGKHIVLRYSLIYTSSPYYNMQPSGEEQVSSK